MFKVICKNPTAFCEAGKAYYAEWSYFEKKQCLKVWYCYGKSKIVCYADYNDFEIIKY